MPKTPPKRKQTRLTHFNYAQAGYYFVTICISRRREILGSISDGAFWPSPADRQAEASWEELPAHHPLIHLDSYVIMPNHVHGIVVLEWTPAPASPPQLAPASALRSSEQHPDRAGPGPDRDSLGAIIGSYKSAVSRKLHWKKKYGYLLWQRSFFDRVIRTDEELHRVREYIESNPLSWHLDELNNKRQGCNSFYDWLQQ